MARIKKAKLAFKMLLHSNRSWMIATWPKWVVSLFLLKLIFLKKKNSQKLATFRSAIDKTEKLFEENDKKSKETSKPPYYKVKTCDMTLPIFLFLFWLSSELVFRKSEQMFISYPNHGTKKSRLRCVNARRKVLVWLTA